MVKQSLIAGWQIVFVLVATAPFTSAQQLNRVQQRVDTAQGLETKSHADTRAGFAGMRHNVAHYMTECLIRGNEAQIKLAQVAERRASDPQVKKFAHLMFEAHTAFLNKLRSTQPQRPGQATNNPATEGKPVVNNNAASRVQLPRHAGANSTADPARRGNRQMAGGAHQFVRIMKEVEEQSLQSMVRELNQKEGAQFDRCYMGGQILAHMWLTDELSVFSRYAVGDLQPVFQEELQTMKQHLDHAKRIEERLAGGNRAAFSRARSAD